MKFQIKILALFAVLISCKNQIKNDSKLKDEVMDSSNKNFERLSKYQNNESLVVETQNDLIGNYIGWFIPDIDDEKMLDKSVIHDESLYWGRQNKINISIDSIQNGLVYGHSVVAGNMRPFNGSLKESSEGYDIEVNEPGTDKYDGVFKMKVIKHSNTLTGTWTAFKKIDIQQRKFDLEKNLFIYNPDQNIENFSRYADWSKFKIKKEKYEDDDGVYEEITKSFSSATDKIYIINASNTLLTKKDVENLKKGDLLIIRNTIYARHGYSFKNRTLRVFFDRQEWYVPYTVDIKSELTEIELKNIELLLKYEKNAEEYYDTFGRG